MTAKAKEPSKGGIDWLAIKTQYIAGAEYAELAEEHGVKEATIRQRAKRGEWSQERHAASLAVTERAVEAIVEDRASKLAELNAIDLAAAEALRAKANELLESVTTPNELKALSGTFDAAQKISRLALGASTENNSVTTKELPASVDDFV